MKRKIISSILIAILFCTQIQFIFAATKDELENQKNDIKTKMNEAEEKKEEVENELDEQMSQIKKLDIDITKSETEISELTAKISTLETSINEKTEQMEKKEKEYNEKDELLRKRLVTLHEDGNTTFLDVLFNSESLLEFISNYDTLQQITECDNELMDQIQTEKAEIEKVKKELEEEKTQKETARKEKEVKSNTLKVKKEERQEKANALSEEQKTLQSKIDDFASEIKAVDNAIQEALKKAEEDLKRKQAEEKRRQEEERKKNQTSSNSNGGSTTSSTNTGSGLSGIKFDGSFVWPCNNKQITSTVKMRWGRWHKGIDIGARYENVYASASGYAYNLNNPGGYGIYIMVVHGDGYITLYGHLNQSKVSDGQYVKQGQVIAQSGNTGGSSGPHLHFEVRKASSLSGFFSSSFLNPLDYLPGGYTLLPGANKSS